MFKEIPQQQAGPTAEAPKAVLLKQTLTAEWRQAASAANPLATPVHMTEGPLAQHTCQNTAHPAPQVCNGVCTIVSPHMNNKSALIGTVAFGTARRQNKLLQLKNKSQTDTAAKRLPPSKARLRQTGWAATHIAERAAGC